MKINKLVTYPFGYSNILKTLYQQDKLPIEKGFYGEKLTKDTVSLEHLKPHSQGGKTKLNNLVLADKFKNNQRSNKPLKEFFDPKKAKEYLDQFVNLIVPYNEKGVKKVFDGNKYIQEVTETITNLLKNNK
ncbi:MAG: hypothetical protein MJ211_10115 [Bacteroidales bacterium]|nr:hypothetical protein [Bacteroidales bacterium]